MDGYRHALPLVVLVGMFCLCGASCPGGRNPFSPQQPVIPVLPANATLEQIIPVVNANSAKIQSLSSNDAQLSVPSVPTLSAQLAFERPQRLRLRAGLGFGGAPELDLGSNDELFWFWVGRSDPAVYFCRHDQFGNSRARNLLPLRPEWLIDALGVNGFDPSLSHQGPRIRPDGRLEITTFRETPEGPTTTISVVDPVPGMIVERHIYRQQQWLASATVKEHRRDPLSGAYLPQRVELQTPDPTTRTRFSLLLNLGHVQINRLSGDPGGLWALPNTLGPLVDLCAPSPPLAPATPGAAPAGPVGTGVPGGTAARVSPGRTWNRLLH